MNNLVYYFTGIGNSLKVAKEFLAGLEDTNLVRITHDLKENDELRT